MNPTNEPTDEVPRVADPAERLGVDADFAHQVLSDLYAYRRKRRGLAWALWALSGWAGGHRFYLGRTGIGVLMLFTGGGGLVWWAVDAFYLNRMVDAHNAEQERRAREGLPPLELAFMPPLAVDALREPPAWRKAWAQRTGFWKAVRLGGDLLVLFVVGATVGAVAGARGGEEAMFAAIAVVLVTVLGGDVGRLDRIPLARGLVLWSHRIRLFYYYNRPGSPPELLVRSAVGILLAPFRRRERAEVLMYIHVGAVFALIFLVVDIVDDVVVPLFDIGIGALAPGRLLGLVAAEAFMTFLLVYAFVTPIGAILNLHLLTRRTHLLPRILGGFTLFAIALTLFG